MDSLTQLTLGAAVGEATLGKKVGRKASLWGAALGTLPDLDVLIPMGDPIADFVYHRSFTHSFFMLGLLAPLCAWLIMRFHKWDPSLFKRTTIATILIFYTHILLDSITVYGTQIFWPFTNYPVSIGSLFIVDPFYTVPMILGLLICFIVKNKDFGLKANNIALSISTIYIVWSLIIQSYVTGLAKESLQGKTLRVERVLAIPTPFNTLLWRIIAVGEEGYYVGYYSLFDKTNNVKFKLIPSRYDLIEKLEPIPRFQDMQRHTHGFLSIDAINDQWMVSDIRMGAENAGYVFQFGVARDDEQGNIKPIEINRYFSERDLSVLNTIFQRIFDESAL